MQWFIHCMMLSHLAISLEEIYTSELYMATKASISKHKSIKKGMFCGSSNIFSTMSKAGKYTNVFVYQPLNYFYLIKQNS